MTQEQAQQTGTRNETYDVIAVLYHALQGAENCQRYINDAQNDQARSFFEQALQMQRQLADQGKQVLQQVIQNDTGGGSAFGWQQSGQSQFGQQSQPQTGDFVGSSPSIGGGQGGQSF
jgi:uncharacterized iron-regulated membrane protein